MFVRMTQEYAATYEGGNLPPVGEVFDCNPDGFGELLVQLGVAEVVDAPPAKPKHRRAPKAETADAPTGDVETATP